MNQKSESKRKAQPSRRWTLKEREELLRAYTSSGLSAWSFARSRGITPTTFYGWIKKCGNKTEVAPKFASYEVSVPTNAMPVEMVFSNGTKLRFDPGVPAGKLSEWVGILQKVKEGPQC
jgi:transposase-like protein